MQEAIGFIVILSTAIISSLLWYKYEVDRKKALTNSIITTVIILQLIMYFEEGYISPFIIITIITSAIVAYIVSKIIGKLIKPNNEKT